ncbi:transposable element Tcb1 transposase [Trichonephila clavipes]|nr:transposable element Tcb1 transposase [Trichonephila clavipes]
MSRRKQRPAFDQVSEFDRGRVVGYRDIVDYLSGKSVVVLDETKQLDGSLSHITNHSIRKTSIAWSTLDAEPQTSPPPRRLWVVKWNEVVFTDESRICLQHHDGRIRVWRHGGERMLNSCVMHRHTGPAPGIMVWDGIGYHSRTPALYLRGVGASCPSLPSGLGHSRYSVG